MNTSDTSVNTVQCCNDTIATYETPTHTGRMYSEAGAQQLPVSLTLLFRSDSVVQPELYD